MNTKDFQDGVRHGKNSVLVDLLGDSDKYTLIKALFRKAHFLAETEIDPVKKAMLEGYSEGFRHSLNILDNLGEAMETYGRIMNPSITIPITKNEIHMLN